jgi:hypothetical protein
VAIFGSAFEKCFFAAKNKKANQTGGPKVAFQKQRG